LCELFAKSEFLFFRDEIIHIRDQLIAHGVKDAAEVFYAMARDFPECPRSNPYSRSNPNWTWFEETLERAERDDEAEEFWARYRHLQRDRLRIERGLQPSGSDFTGERPRSGNV
jgi:hypothetical protein